MASLYAMKAHCGISTSPPIAATVCTSSPIASPEPLVITRSASGTSRCAASAFRSATALSLGYQCGSRIAHIIAANTRGDAPNGG